MDLSSFGRRISLALFHVEEKMPYLRQSVYNRLSGLPIDLIAIDLIKYSAGARSDFPLPFPDR